VHQSIYTFLSDWSSYCHQQTWWGCL
jgi:hypothetical protein